MYDIETNFNNTFQSGINAVPMEIFEGKKREDEKVNRFEKLKINDSVRIKTIFKKNILDKKI